MSKVFRHSALLLIMLLITGVSFAQGRRLETVQIKTSAECDMCKKAIEKEMGFTKGVKKADLDVNSHVLTVSYNPKKVSLDEIRNSISKIGYDADDVKAQNKAYDKLPDCCKKGAGKDCEPKKKD